MMRKILSILMLVCCLAALSIADPILYDDFESYEVGSVDEVTKGKWVISSTPVDVVMPVLGNKYCDVDGGDVYTSLGDFEIPNTDTETTVFFRVYSENAKENSLIGLADDGDTSPDSYGDMDAYIQFVDGYMYARNGSSGVHIWDNPPVPGWFNVWIVVNASAHTYDVYANTGTENATSSDLLANDYAFRSATGSNIVSFANVYGSGLMFDDVYITPGLDLTNPPVNTTITEADDMSRAIWEDELPVADYAFADTGSRTVDSAGWGTVAAWNGLEGTFSGSGITDEVSSDGDGWCGEQTREDPGFYQVTDVDMIEGTTYGFTAYNQNRWSAGGMNMSIVGGDPNSAALATATYEIRHDDGWQPISVSYTATAADAGKKIGVKFEGFSDQMDNSWFRVDDVHLYTGYYVVHGAQDPSPATAETGVTPGTVSLSWTPSNDPNLVGQTLYYFVDDYVDFADVDGYESDATEEVVLDAIVSTQDITAGYDKYVMWRVDTTVSTSSTTTETYTGETWYCVTDFTDEVPIVTAGSGWLTYVGGPMPTLTADIDDSGEGDIDNANVVWTVNSEDATVTKTSSDPLVSTASFYTEVAGEYTVKITATDTDGSLGVQSDEATIVVRVAEDACDASINYAGGSYPESDFDRDCDVDFDDLATLAANWLDSSALSPTEPRAE